MKPINRLFYIFGLLTLILSACQPLLPPAVQDAPVVSAVEQSAPAVPAAEPHGLRGDAPPYAVHGPYAVGVGNFEIEATTENERPLTVTVWYPALNPQGAPASVTYEMGFSAGETPNISIFGHAIENAQPAVDGAPYPLIVHTHGHWSFRQESAYLDEHLASMGFVVISADHEDNWSTLFGPKAWQSEFRRPNEVTREIDYAEKLGADGGSLAGIVDTGRVGVFGWSYGGETALVAAGARLDLGKLRAWCEENKVDDEFPDTDCVDILDHEAELAALAGLTETPQGLWPDWSDERIDAVIGLAPWVGSLSEASLQTLTVPTLLMIGSSDTASGPTYQPFQPYQKITAERKAEVVFENAEHPLFFSACQDVPEVVALGLEVICTDPVWDMARAHDLINHFAAAFLLAELKGDTDAAAALSPENVAFTGIQYQEMGYSEASKGGAAAEPQPPQGLRPDAPAFAIHGPFAVGYQPLVIGEATDHPLDASLWYPALNPNGAKEEITYTIHTKIPVEGMEATAPVYGHALLDGEIDPSGAPYPLVIYSHGFASNGAWASALLEHFASYGFIVLAPEHTEQFDFDWSEIPTASIDRPLDIKQTLDYAEEMNGPGGALDGLIDMQNIAVIGHSYGGYTALAMAGAQYDLDAFNARCAELAPENPNTLLCAPIVPKEAEMAARAGLEPMPAGLWPSFGDPRVTAILPIAGDSYLFDQAGLSKITIPVMAIGGTADTGTPYTWGSQPTYAYASSERKVLVGFEGGEHFILSSCEEMPWWSATPFYGWVCFDPVWDKDRSRDLINHFATAFLLAELKGDAEAASALAAENVSFPGIQYQETGYTEPSEVSPAAEPQPPQGLRPDAPEFAIHGPFAVGTHEFVIETAERVTPLTIWYPALNPEGKPEQITYRMDVGDQGLPPFPVLGNAIPNALPDLSGAPYPLVVWSHGAYLYRQTNAYLAEHLASQGFVVVAGNHEDNWGTFPAPNVTSDISRPADISAWIDFAEEKAAAGSELAGLIDSERIAVGGHSYGGYTALTVAGARYNPRWYLDVVCATNTLAEDDPLNTCSAQEKALPELATLAGLDAVPEGLWPSWQDPRVDAIFLLAPSSVFGAEGSAPVTIPTMSLTGSADPMQDPALHVYLTHENLGSANKSLVVFQDGGHTMFLNDCTSATGMADVAFEWCSDPVWNTDRVHDLTNYFATAFLKAELYGDGEADAALAPENVSFPGITYETTGYGAAGESAP